MRRGFTYIELILVMGIFALLSSLTTINFFNTYPKANVRATQDILIADLKSQQSRAMAGEGLAGAPSPGWGIKFFADHYVLFSGVAYNPASPNNTLINLPANLSLITNLPNSGEIVFGRGTGEVLGYVAGSDTVTLVGGSNTGLIRLNQYGTITGD